MKKLFLAILVSIALCPAVASAQMSGMDVGAEQKAADMNRDDYPYSVLARGPILAPYEREKARRNYIRYEQYKVAREQAMVRQFRTMSADERRYVIESQGYPRGVLPGYK